MTSGLHSSKSASNNRADRTSHEPTHIFTAVADMPPGACTKCAEKGRVGVCIMCKITPPYDEGVYTMVRPLRLGKHG